MTIEFPCPECAQLVRTPDTAAGKRGKCPSCAAVVQIPAAIPAAKPAVKQAPAPPSAPKTTPPKTTALTPAADDSGPIEFFCSSCGQLVRTPRAAAGKKGKCPHCAEIVLIPLTNKPAASGKTPAPAPSVTKQSPPQPARKLIPKPKIEEDPGLAELDDAPSPGSKPRPTPVAPKPAARPASAPRPAVRSTATSLPARQAPLAALPPVTPLGPAAVDPFATFGGALFPGSAPPPVAMPGLDPLPDLTPLDSPLDLDSTPILAEAFDSPIPVFSDPFAALPTVKSLPALPAATAFAPALPADKASVGNHDTAVNIPAILQLIVTFPMLLLFGFTLLRQVWGFINLTLVLGRSQSPASNYASSLIISVLISLLVTAACVVMQGWIIFGSSKQLQRQSYNQALAAAWMSLIPCVSPMGMPFGIWSLVMLYKDPVKRSFRG